MDGFLGSPVPSQRYVKMGNRAGGTEVGLKEQNMGMEQQKQRNGGALLSLERGRQASPQAEKMYGRYGGPCKDSPRHGCRQARYTQSTLSHTPAGKGASSCTVFMVSS